MTVENDFKATGNNNIDFNHKVGTIFIVKKNKSILNNLLKELNRLTGNGWKNRRAHSSD